MSTDLDNFVATVEHRRPGRILYDASFVGDLHRRVVEHIGTDDIAGHYGYFRPVHVGGARPADLPPLEFSRYWKNETLPAGATINGMGVAQVPSGFYHFWGYVSPLRNAKSIKEIEEYPMDDVGTYDFSGMAAKVADAHAAGRVALLGTGHMYENAWQIRGYEQFLMDTIERPAWAECLLERFCQNNIIKAREAAKAGVDCLHCGDDVASQGALMFSKPTWEKLIRSRWERVWRAAKEIKPDIRVFYHSDGNVYDIVEDMANAGLDILNPVQPECLSLDAVHERWGARLTFYGCLGTQSTMPWGTPDDVRACIRELIEKYGKHGGLVIAPTHVLEPEVPLANIDAMAEACREYGTFE